MDQGRYAALPALPSQQGPPGPHLQKGQHGSRGPPVLSYGMYKHATY